MLNQHANDIFTIDNFWSKQECEAFISKSEAIGYELATVTTEKGQKVIEEVRNNNRLIYIDRELADQIWQDLKMVLPTQFGNSIAIGLNEMFRFYRYQAGQHFRKHRDQSFIRNEFEASYFTFMIYLNDNYDGGETIFNRLTIHPKQGTTLIFQHDLEHEGNSVRQGIKYILRTDIMYRLES